MKWFPTPILLGLLVSVCLAVGACGASGTGPLSGATPGPGATPTATPALGRPTSVPVASMAECGRLLALSEANQDTQPVSPATSIVALEVNGTGLCYYETAQHQTNVALVFKPYSGGTLTENVQKAVSGSVSKVTITSSQPIGGIGDQALYVTLTGSSTVNGASVPVKENILFGVAGAVSFGIINIIYNTVDPLGSASAATVLSDFEQVARLVIMRL
jgi:hypothetical protein